MDFVPLKLLGLFIFSVSVGSLCAPEDISITLLPGEEWRSICETASSSGHLFNYSLLLTNLVDIKPQVRALSGANCYSQLQPTNMTGTSCFRDQDNCSSVSFTSQTPVCLIISNPWFSEKSPRIIGTVSYEIPTGAVDPLYPLQFYLKNTGQQNGTAGEDINVEPVWAQNITGAGVIIDFVGDGLYSGHQDLFTPDKLRLDLSWNYRTNLNDPSPTTGFLSRGTGCAGIAAGIAANSVCGKGVAYNAQLSAHRVPLHDPFTLATSLYDVQHGNDTIDITTCLYCQIPACYGFSFCNYFPENPMANQALQMGTQFGRQGKGRIFIMPAGGNTLTGNITNSDINMNPYAKQRQVISVMGTNNRGGRDLNSDMGACILVNAPSSTVRNPRIYRNSGGLTGRGMGVTTVSTFSPTACTSNFRGGARTAAAIVSGVVALVLEVNPNLNWRQVQKVLIETSTRNFPNSTSWFLNNAGYWYSRYYGFGRVNAEAAVALAKQWKDNNQVLGEENSFSTKTFKVESCIPDNADGPVVSVTTVETGIHQLESVAVVLNIQHQSIGDLQIYLTSPSGTKILLKNHTPSEEPHWATRIVNRFPVFISDFHNYPLYARCFYGETGNGKWELSVSDTKYNNISGIFTDWQLLIWGTGPGCFITNNCTTPSSTITQAQVDTCSSPSSGKTSHTLAIVGGLIGGFTVGALLVWWYFTAKNKAKEQQNAVIPQTDLDGPLLQ